MHGKWPIKHWLVSLSSIIWSRITASIRISMTKRRLRNSHASCRHDTPVCFLSLSAVLSVVEKGRHLSASSHTSFLGFGCPYNMRPIFLSSCVILSGCLIKETRHYTGGRSMCNIWALRTLTLLLLTLSFSISGFKVPIPLLRWTFALQALYIPILKMTNYQHPALSRRWSKHEIPVIW